MLPTQPAQRHRAVAREFSDRVAGVADWAAPAPVDGWTARDVVGHLVEWFPGFLAAGGVQLSPGPAVADDPAGAWNHHTEQVQGLLDGPDATSEFSHPMAGSMPLAAAIDNFYTADVFMHTWDLARASGQNVALDEEFCATLLEGMAQMEEVLRSSGQYGPAVPVSDDAPVQDRLVAFIGRDPHWSPDSP
ncbi:TIGR03086 family metal-binding protein [Gordonia crocea]|uniref:Mycothiol-dependent maleylpyruvate isomerase metal-binding domain-containing protein n=1 Tax=Gordonia crocea TaxID=589162 RepID=A0A7I9UVR7_9ACTN|nr:TIGR03086 family metal-binding protein [Gordonia crocea]GED97079.1 hypothetical protein nbrc107697_11180 [Gordonia crocea]